MGVSLITACLVLTTVLAAASAQETYEPGRIICYLSQGAHEYMQYTVNSDKYQCVKYRYRCTASMAGSCTEQQVARNQWRNFYAIMTPEDCLAKQAEAADNPANLKAVVCCSTSECAKPKPRTEPFLRLSFHFGEIN